jgi:hypothetical protein
MGLTERQQLATALRESRAVYDGLLVIAPLLLALTARWKRRGAARSCSVPAA